ncbi:interferon regulatory factor 9 isoform X3 [Rhinolophus sinicus]|uniref:interferon regulatory factor 9 isoform X3 n=1 Tax=Rhinolophus sinicus TaxID=89399 RepID=UPI003D79EF11
MKLRPCSGFPGSMPASRTSGRTRMPPSSRPGRYLRESTRRGTQKAPLSGRLVCAVLSTKVLSLRRFLRTAIGMGLSPIRCIGCCHQEPSLLQQEPRNHHQRDSTALCPPRGRSMRVPRRTVYSAPPCSRTHSKPRRWGPMGAQAIQTWRAAAKAAAAAALSLRKVLTQLRPLSKKIRPPWSGCPLQTQSPVLTRWTPGRGTGTVGRSLSADYSLLLTFIYSGHVVGEAQVQSLDCRLVAEPSGSQCGMEQVVFPKPGPQEPTQRLLSQLERGVLVASNARGLFVQRLCPIPVSWSAPQTPPGPGPHLLPSNECVELFRTTYFCRDLARYFQGLGPPPKFQVTLNFWEETPGPSHTLQSLITVQMEQAFARHLLQETPEDEAAILSLLQSLGDPPSSSPLCSSSFP